MIEIPGPGKEVLDKAEWAAIATVGPTGPHLVGTWGEYLRTFPFQGGKRLLLPAGNYRQTEENLRKDPRVEILLGTRQVKDSRGGHGRGLSLSGTAELHVSGPDFEMVREKFPWARAALVVTLRGSKIHL